MAKKSSFYSPEYGVIDKTNKLTTAIRARMPLEIKHSLNLKKINKAIKLREKYSKNITIEI